MPAFPPPIDARLLSLDDAGRATLLAGRDRDSGRLVFPAPDDHTRFEPATLPRNGVLWSWTVQRFRPKSPPYAGPAAFEPYAVGYVALGDAIIVEGRLTGAPIDGFSIGMPMTLVREDFAMADGGLASTFAFSPAGAAQ